jgi:hypothetical protein
MLQTDVESNADDSAPTARHSFSWKEDIIKRKVILVYYKVIDLKKFLLLFSVKL